jgi:hypothetical protein
MEDITQYGHIGIYIPFYSLYHKAIYDTVLESTLQT